MGNDTRWELGSIIENKNTRNGNQRRGMKVSLGFFSCPNSLEIKLLKKKKPLALLDGVMLKIKYDNSGTEEGTVERL